MSIDIIDRIPEILNYLLPGFLFWEIFEWKFGKNKRERSAYFWIQCVLVSVLIKAGFSMVHMKLYSQMIVAEPIKVLLFNLAGAIFAIVIGTVLRTPIARKWFPLLFGRTFSDYLLDDIIDYKCPTTIAAFPKGKSYFFLGRFSQHEFGENPRVALVDYDIVDRESLDTLISFNDENSILAFRLNDMEHIEVIHEDDSKVWAEFKRGD